MIVLREKDKPALPLLYTCRPTPLTSGVDCIECGRPESAPITRFVISCAPPQRYEGRSCEAALKEQRDCT